MKVFWGEIFIAVGILIAGGSGICSLSILFGSGGVQAVWSIIPLVLIVGGLPFALGIAMVFGGRSIIRRAREEQAER